MSALRLRRLHSDSPHFPQQLRELLAFDRTLAEGVEQAVAEILEDVRLRGEAAVLAHTERLDGVRAATLAELEVPRTELRRSLASLSATDSAALRLAAQRIRAYHERQCVQSWSFEEIDGTRLGQRVSPIDRVGMYVPGGKASYPSSVLMNAVPAKVAGVRELIMVVPAPHGERNPLVLAAAELAGVDRVFTIGGAQAIAALAYGTATFARVDKIVGPGNAYVAAAKRRLFGVVGIDMIAGPSEILVIADEEANPDWVAMDLFSQAEHDESAQAILLTPSEPLLQRVEASMNAQLNTLSRREIIVESLRRRGALIQVKDLEEACAIANEIAPEHLELAVADPEQWLALIRHAGAVFLGYHSSEAIGDYCAGANHVLPTSRSARFASPLGVYDFQKRTSIVHISKASAAKLGEVAQSLALAEGLEAHARAAKYRM